MNWHFACKAFLVPLKTRGRFQPHLGKVQSHVVRVIGGKPWAGAVRGTSPLTSKRVRKMSISTREMWHLILHDGGTFQ